jgi:hypothetical protein
VYDFIWSEASEDSLTYAVLPVPLQNYSWAIWVVVHFGRTSAIFYVIIISTVT